MLYIQQIRELNKHQSRSCQKAIRPQEKTIILHVPKAVESCIQRGKLISRFVLKIIMLDSQSFIHNVVIGLASFDRALPLVPYLILSLTPFVHSWIQPCLFDKYVQCFYKISSQKRYQSNQIISPKGKSFQELSNVACSVVSHSRQMAEQMRSQGSALLVFPSDLSVYLRRLIAKGFYITLQSTVETLFPLSIPGAGLGYTRS